MKILQALAIVAATMILSNCSKSDDKPKQGTFTFQNNSTNPYQVFVNGKNVVSMQPGHTSQTVTYACGSYTVRVLQLEGYVLYPTEKTFKGSLVCGGKATISFP